MERVKEKLLAQIQSEMPVKGTNLIVIETTDSIEVSFSKMIQILRNNNISIEDINEQFYSIRTGKEGVKHGQYTLDVYLVQSSDLTQVKISGNVQATLLGFEGVDEIEFKKSKSNLYRATFDQMQEVALSYDGGIVKYYTVE